MLTRKQTTLSLRIAALRRWIKNVVFRHRYRKVVVKSEGLENIPVQQLKKMLGPIDEETRRCILVCGALLLIGRHFSKNHLDFKATQWFMQWINGSMTDRDQLQYIAKLMQSTTLNRDVYNWLLETGDITEAMIRWHLSDSDKRETFQTLLADPTPN